MADINKLVAAISPDIYCDPSVRADVKKKLKELGPEKGYQEAAKIAKFVPNDELFNIDNAKMMPLATPGLKAPFEQHKLVYDSPSETLEPLYFWILDFMNGMFRNKVTKITDNFFSSPGSGHFSELGTKMTKMQDEAMRMLAGVNQVLKSILNIVYDLKEFKMRLKEYDLYRDSKNPAERSAALLALKQIWLDNVDIKRGTTSIKGMAQQFDYVTLIDAFMATSSLEQLSKPANESGALDLNDRVRRLLEQRVGEFFIWLTESEKELRKRFEIEKHYLRSQYSTIQLYSRWIKPYLKAARSLEQNQNLSTNAALVTTFNTILLELMIMGEAEYDAADDVQKGDLPELFKYTKGRKYSAILVVDLKFRGIPQRVAQGYAFGGRTEATFTAYALNDEELKILKKELDKDSFNDVLSLIEGATTQSLDEIKKDIESFINEEKDEKEKKEAEEKKKQESEDINPFSSLFSPFFSKKKPKEEEKKSMSVPKSDDQYERVFRSQAIVDARERCKTLFETYKKAHQMPAF